MKVFIETYRTFAIFFDTDRERFACEIDSENWAEKQSFNAAKKFIDEHIKNNVSFEPFYVVLKWDKYGNKRVKITGVRKDGNFVGINEKNEQVTISKYDENKYMLDLPENEQYFAKVAIIESEREYENKQYSTKIKEIQSNIKVISLKELKSKYTQPK